MKEDNGFVWAEPPTKHISKFDAAINAALDNPGKWLKLPEPSKNSNTGLRQVVRRHNLPIKITTRLRSDGMFDIYAVCTTAITDTALPDVPDMKGYDAEEAD